MKKNKTAQNEESDLTCCGRDTSRVAIAVDRIDVPEIVTWSGKSNGHYTVPSIGEIIRRLGM